MKTKNILTCLSIVLFLAASAFAHGNVIYSIGLNFDPDFEEGIISAAQKYLKLNEEPVDFDFDYELINVKFDRDLEYSVLIHPVTYTVHGFRDDRLMSFGKEEKFTADGRRKIAQEIFDNLPESYTKDLIFGEEKKLYSGIYELTWYRYVDGVYVANDHLKVEVDSTDGDLIAWRLSPFFYKTSQLRRTPAITSRVAQKIAELKFGAEPIGFTPLLIIERGKPVWITKVKSIYPIFVGVDAVDGKVLYSGNIRTTLPDEYDYGSEVEVVETDFIKELYAEGE